MRLNRLLLLAGVSIAQDVSADSRSKFKPPLLTKILYDTGYLLLLEMKKVKNLVGHTGSVFDILF